MKLGIMQPYFFPYLGHFSVILSSDEWIVFDVTQYTPKSWMNRNRILHPDRGWQYITVPLANSSRGIRIFEARTFNLEETHQTIRGKFSHYRRRAPYYDSVMAIIDQTFGSNEDRSLVDINVKSLALVCSYLNIPFNYKICSKLNLVFPPHLGPGDWALAICEQLGATEYINPLGGRELFSPQQFREKNIKLQFASMNDYRYDTSPYSFESNLSILDVLLWNSSQDVMKFLKENTNLTNRE